MGMEGLTNFSMKNSLTLPSLAKIFLTVKEMRMMNQFIQIPIHLKEILFQIQKKEIHVTVLTNIINLKLVMRSPMFLQKIQH